MVNKPTGLFSIKKGLNGATSSNGGPAFGMKLAISEEEKLVSRNPVGRRSRLVRIPVIYQQAASSGKDIDRRYLLCISPPSGAVETGKKNKKKRFHAVTHTSAIKMLL